MLVGMIGMSLTEEDLEFTIHDEQREMVLECRTYYFRICLVMYVERVRASNLRKGTKQVVTYSWVLTSIPFLPFTDFSSPVALYSLLVTQLMHAESAAD